MAAEARETPVMRFGEHNACQLVGQQRAGRSPEGVGEARGAGFLYAVWITPAER